MRHGCKRAAAPSSSGVREQKHTQWPQSRHPQSCIGCWTLSRQTQGWQMCPTAGRWPPSHPPLQYLRVSVGRCVRFLGCKGWDTGLLQEGDSWPQVPVQCPSGVFVPPLKALLPFLFAPETLISNTCRPRPFLSQVFLPTNPGTVHLPQGCFSEGQLPHALWRHHLKALREPVPHRLPFGERHGLGGTGACPRSPGKAREGL